MSFKTFRPPLGRRPLLGVLVAVGGTAGLSLALLPFRDHLDNATSGLSFLVPLVLGAAIGGVAAAASGVIAGFVAYNVLFTPPYGTLAVEHLPDVVGLFVYSLVGALTAVIVTLHQREVDAARRREAEAVTLSEMSRSLISGVGLHEVLRPMVRRARQLFGLRAAMVVLSGVGGVGGLTIGEGDELVVIRSDAGGPPRFDDTDVSTVELSVDDAVIGWLVVAGDVGGLEQRVLRSFADHAALAINRSALVERATRVKVLEEADRLRSSLVRSVSHDLRTPLASITAAAEDLAEPDLHLAAEDRRVLASTIAQESRRLDRLVGDLLNVSRIESGRLEVYPQVVDVTDLIGQAAGPALRDRIEVATTDEELLVEADPVLIEQVLRNLMDNACRYSPVGDRVTVRAARVGDGLVVVEVLDRGPGVPVDQRERIFEAFFAADDGVRSRATGVGLAICHGFVVAHGGSIWVDDAPGGGARFAFTLPEASAPPADGPVGRGRPEVVSGG